MESLIVRCCEKIDYQKVFSTLLDEVGSRSGGTKCRCLFFIFVSGAIHVVLFCYRFGLQVTRCFTLRWEEEIAKGSLRDAVMLKCLVCALPKGRAGTLFLRSEADGMNCPACRLCRQL